MSKKIDKALILSKIKSHYNFEKDADFARFLEIKPQTLSSWYSRNTFDIELLYSKCVEINPEWLLTGEGEMLKSDNNTPAVAEPQIPSGVPMLPFDAFAGIGTDVEGVNLDTIEERYVVPLFDGMKMDFMISVRGSSMYPKYNSGDVVACRMVQELLFVQWNKVYVLDTISQGVIIKRLKKSDKEGFVICKSDNEQYEPFEIPMSDIRTIALVVGVIRLE